MAVLFSRLMNFLIVFIALSAVLFLPANLALADDLPVEARQCCVCTATKLDDPDYSAAAGCTADESEEQCVAKNTPLGSLANTRQSCSVRECGAVKACGEIDKPEYNLDPVKLKLNIPIPGLEAFSTGEGVVVNNSTIALYLGALYRFLVGLAGIAAVMVIAFGGIIWLFSGGEASRITKAKELITGAIVGLGLALASYVLLYAINPKLVQFKGLPIPEIARHQFVSEDKGDNICSSDDLVVRLPAINKISVTASDPRTLVEVSTKLKMVSRLLGAGESLVITSAYRGSVKQAELYNCYMSAVNQRLAPGVCPPGCTSCAEAAKPGCVAPHQTGKAVDVCLKTEGGVNTCSYIGNKSCNGGNCLSGNAKIALDNAQRSLQVLMATVGFSRYCGEWWHFESTAVSPGCAPGVYSGSGSGG